MKSPQDLHTIIKSLSKSEKRLFKLQVSGSQKSENNYTILFDAIDAQEEYDEPKLQRKLRKHTFSKQISKTKFLLYKQILKVLQQFYSTRCEYAKLDVLIHSFDVLFHKTLYTQAYKILKRGKKIALVNQLTGWQQKFLEKEQQLLPFLENHKTIQLATKEFLKSYEQVTQKLHTENLYRSLHTKVRLHYDTFFNFHESTPISTLFDEIMEHPLMKDETKASTFFSKVLFMEITFLNAQVHFDFSKAFYWGKKMFEYWQENPHMKSIFKMDFIRQLRDFTFCKITYGNLDDDLTEELEEWNTVKTNAQSKQEEQKYQIEIDAFQFINHLTRNNHSEAEVIYSKITTNSASINLLPIYQRITIFYHIAVYHFFKKEYKATWSIIEKINSLGNSKLDPHIMKYVRLMELILQYELDDLEINHNDIQNIHVALSSIGVLGKVEETLLEMMKELIGIKENLQAFHPIKKLIENNQPVLKQHPSLISHQILHVWINDKIKVERKYA